MTQTSSPAFSPAPRSRHRTAPRQRAERAVVAAISAILAVTAPAAPTGTTAVDALWLAAVGAVVPLAASRARRSALVPLLVAALIVADGAMTLVAVGAAAAALLGAARRRRSVLLSGLAGACAVQVLLRAGDGPFLGSTLLLGLAATIPVLVSAYSMSPRRTRRFALRAGLALAALLALGAISAAAGAAMVRSDVEGAVSDARDALDAARSGDTDTAQVLLLEAESGFDAAHSVFGGPAAWPARAVPLVGQHAVAVGDLSAQGRALAHAAREAIAVVDYESLRYDSGRFDLDAIEAAVEPLRTSATASDDAWRAVRDIDAAWLLPPLRDRLDEFAAELSDARTAAALAAEAAAAAPAMLGGDGPRTYFVAFVTPAEQRGSGGFMGNYGELTAIDGRVRLTRSGRVRELIDAAPPGSRAITGPADYVRRYGEYQVTDYLQDVFVSPDFPMNAQVMAQLYPQSGGKPVDGVLSVDPFGLAALLHLTGPVTVEGLATPLTASNAASVLLRDQYVLFPDDERVDVLDDASRATFEALTTGSLPEPREASEILSPMVREGRFKMWSPRASEQRLMARVGLDWAVPAVGDDDLLGITSQNGNPNKIDVYMQREVTYRATVDPESGDLHATVEVRLHNTAPTTGLPVSVIGNGRGLPPGTNRTVLAVYTPHVAEAADVDGFRVPISSQREAGLRVHERTIDVAPGATVTFTLELSGKIADPDDYRLTLLPHPSVNADRYDIEVDLGAMPTVTTGGVALVDGISFAGEVATTTKVEARRDG